MRGKQHRVFLIAALAATLCLALPAAAKTEEGFKIKAVREVGYKIELNDGSVWKVPNPADQEIAYNWLPYQDVAIIDGKTLLNEHRGERIDAEMTQPPVSAGGAAGASAGAASATPQYPASAASAGAAAAPAAPAAVPPKLEKKLDTILDRLESLDAKIQVMDWRLRQLESERMVKP
jgi:hypothetical protein